MRTVRRRVLVPLAAVAASTALLACHHSDSILLIEVAGDLALAPASLQVTVMPAGTAARTFLVAPQTGSAAAVTLPASLSVELPPNLAGPISIMVSAFDAAGYTIATGMVTQKDIDVSGQTIVVVTLGGDVMPGADAGAGGDAGAAGGSGASGGGGINGSGGAGGRGASGAPDGGGSA